MSTTSPRRVRRAFIAVAVLGLGLAAAPAAFQMFSRAPQGGSMLDDFRPHMRQSQIDSFRGHLASIDRSQAEIGERLEEVAGPGPWPAADELRREWPAIQTDMTGMLDDIEANLSRFEAVDALPPFSLFPWFFVIPGVVAIALASWGLGRARRGRSVLPPLAAVAVLGVGLLAAPAAFQMFSRAPAGGDMIDDLRPLMTDERVTTLQQSFLTIGAAEGELRVEAQPAAAARGQTLATELPATADLIDRWPAMSAEMAPMIGAMADNVDNFAAVDALPPFALFPWFFVLPGLLLGALAVAGGLQPGIRAAELPTTKRPNPLVERNVT